MGRTSRAVVVPARCVAELSEVTVPDPGPGEVTVRAVYSGVSTGTDRWIARGQFDWGSSRYPLIPGYQKVGFVVQAGEGAEGWMGRAVFAATARDFGGTTAQSGCHAEYSNHSLEHVYALAGPPSPRLSLGISAQVGYNAAHRIQPSRVRRVAVVGDGIIGLTSALTAIDLGFEVAVVGRHQDRLKIIADAGAAVIGSGASVVEETSAFGPEVIVDTIQTGDSFEIVINALPSDYGQVVYSGFTPGMPDAWASMTRLQQRSITAHFQSGWTRERLATVIECIETDEFGFSKIPIAKFGIDDAERLFRDLIAGERVPLASVIHWGRDT